MPRSKLPGRLRVAGTPRGGRGQALVLTMHKKSRYIQRWFLHNPWVRPFVVFSFAAGKIQSLARGFLIRKEGNLVDYLVFRKERANDYLQLRAARAAGTTGAPKQLDKYLAYIETCKRAEIRNGAVGRTFSGPTWLDGGYSVWCAVRVQSWYRARRIRRRYLYKTRVINQIGALVIQNGWRNYCAMRRRAYEAHMRATRPKPTPTRASVIIQNGWRSYSNRRIYMYYRDLVVDKLQGAPQELLRTIIPNESSLLDRAAGVLARFRLGGAVFPPKIYFKIFTYRGVCDVNAFAPRDYVNEKPNEAVQQNIHERYIPKDRAKYNRHLRVGKSYFGTQVMTATTTNNWYQREERNSWRPLASAVFEDVLTPPWMQNVVKEKKPEPFHFSLLKRRQDQVKHRKLKKREWMRKAYMLSGAADEVVNSNVQLTEAEKRLSRSNIEIVKTIGGRGGKPEKAGPEHGALENGGGLYPYSTNFKKADDAYKSRTYSGDMTKNPRVRARSPLSEFEDDGGDMDRDSMSESLAFLSISQTLDSPSAEYKQQRDNDVVVADGSDGNDQAYSMNARVPSGFRGKLPLKNSDFSNYQQQQQQEQQQQKQQKQLQFTDKHNTRADFTQTGAVANEVEENEDLLEWTRTLNFDDYATDWKTIGTSVPSDRPHMAHG